MKELWSYIALLLYLAILCLIISKWRFFKKTKLKLSWLLLLFAAKVFFGIGLNILYSSYYDKETSDIYRYFKDAEIIHSAIHSNPADYFKMVSGIGADEKHLEKYYNACDFWYKKYNYNLYNDNRIVIRFNAVIRLISFGNIHTHAVILAFLSFLGLTAIYISFRTFSSSKMLATACYLMPSVLLWTSGALKEAILMFSFGLLIYAAFQLIYKKIRFANLLLLLLMFFILAQSKFYVLAAAVPGLISLIVIRYWKTRSPLLIFIGVHTLLFIMALQLKHFTSYDILDILSQKQNDFIRMVSTLQDVGSAVDLKPLEPKLWSFIKATPQAVCNSFCRPHPLEVKSIMMLFAMAENILILSILLIAIRFMKIKNESWPVVLFGLFFTLILFVLSGLTTPVLGALVRYKAPALPFLMMSLFLLIDEQKLQKTLNRIQLFQKQATKLKHHE